jgi:hypothetical protein
MGFDIYVAAGTSRIRSFGNQKRDHALAETSEQEREEGPNRQSIPFGFEFLVGYAEGPRFPSPSAIMTYL